MDEELFVKDGYRYLLRDGSVYKVSVSDDTNVQGPVSLFDPNFIEDNYKVRDGVVMRKAYVPCQEAFYDEFHGTSINDFIGPGANWDSMILLCDDAPTVEQYVRLKDDILMGRDIFKGSVIDINPMRIQFSCLPSPMQVTKSCLVTGRLFFRQGDALRLSAVLRVDKGNPTSLIDIEANYVSEAPGMRLMLDPNLRPYLQLKFGDYPDYKTDFALKPTVAYQVDIDLNLSQDNGSVGMSISGERVLDLQGVQTLPFSSCVYNSLELGITANGPHKHSIVSFARVNLMRVPT